MTMITLITIPETDNPIEARPSFRACLGSDTAELLATTVQTDNFEVSVTFSSHLMDEQLLDVLRHLATLAFDLGGRGACR